MAGKTFGIWLVLLCFSGFAHAQSLPQPIFTIDLGPLSKGQNLTHQLHLTGADRYLLKAVAREAEVRFSGRSNSETFTQHVTDLRGAPLYALVQGQDWALEFSVLRATRRSHLNLMIYRLPATLDGQLLESLSSLHEALENMSSVEYFSPEKLHSLRNQANRENDAEVAGWLQFYLAFVDYLHRYDWQAVTDECQAILRQAGQIPALTIQASNLLGAAMAERINKLPEPVAEARFERAGRFLTTWAELSLKEDRLYDALLAINHNGVRYYWWDQHRQAADQFRRAMQLSLSLDDESFHSIARANFGLALEALGDKQASREILEQLLVTIDVAIQPRFYAEISYELGRQYALDGRFSQALEYIVQALDGFSVIGDTAGLARTQLALGKHYYFIGDWHRADYHLREALNQLQAIGESQGLNLAYQLLADLQRERGQFAIAAQLRAKIDKLILSPLENKLLIFNQATDYVSQQDWRSAARLLQPVLRNRGNALIDAQIALLGEAAKMHLGTAYDRDKAAEAYANIAMSGSADARRQAVHWWLDILYKEGQANIADQQLIAVMEEFIAGLSALPWVNLRHQYLRRHQALMNRYLTHRLSNIAPNDVDAALALLAEYDRIRWVASGQSSNRKDNQATDNRRLHKAIAGKVFTKQADQAGYQQALVGIDYQHLLTDQSVEREQSSGLDLSSLPEDVSVLAYWLGTEQAWCWQLDRQGLRLISLGSSLQIRQAVQALQTELGILNSRQVGARADQLGRLLFDGLAKSLKTNLWVLYDGGLNTIPFDLLSKRSNGGRVPLVREHNIAFLHSLRQRLQGSRQTAAVSNRAVLLGHPQLLDAAGNLAELAGSQAELTAVASTLKPRPVTKLIQQELLLDQVILAVEDEEIDVVHWATHGVVDLLWPEASYLALSQVQDDLIAPEAFLTPADIRQLNLSASMVFLAACETASSAYQEQIGNGLVSDFLTAGAGAVIGTLWKIDDQQSTELATAFYRRWAGNGRDAQLALGEAKRRFIATHGNRYRLWSAYQLYF